MKENNNKRIKHAKMSPIKILITYVAAVLVSSASMLAITAYAQEERPTITIEEDRSFCDEETGVVQIYWFITGLPADVSEYVYGEIVSSDGVTTISMAAHLPDLGETGRTGGGITTSQEQLGDSPYTVYYYEATGPENPEDATINNIRPLEGGIVLSTTFTCETEPPEEEDTTPPDVEITGAVDRSGREITDGSGRTPIPYIRVTFEATDAVGIDTTECSLTDKRLHPAQVLYLITD